MNKFLKRCKRCYCRFQKCFEHEPFIYKQNRVFRKTFLKYKKYYGTLSEDHKLIESAFIEESEKSFDIIYKIRMFLISIFTTLFLPFQVKVFKTGYDQEIYEIIMTTIVVVGLVFTISLSIYWLIKKAPFKYYLGIYIVFLILWCLTPLSLKLDQYLSYHLILSCYAFFCIQFSLLRYLSYKKEILLGRKMAIKMQSI
ncbi:hypothetical protein [uncultured Veillonella sp.]|uniref:hypothetical protein n=1 Tax=uncultured Veillonella sp. TaxID=159268 RepID=UPI0028064DFC|nr:hypothetical protein [uncultured Veillonella sp.]